MILAAVLGAYAAIERLAFTTAFGLIVGLVGAKGAWEIATKRSWITKAPSPYVLYVQGLEERGVQRHPITTPIFYLAQVVGFGALIGGAVYWILRAVL